MADETAVREAGQDFIRDIIRADLAAGRHKSVVTRFPPEPNGYLHIGHAKSICLNFGVAAGVRRPLQPPLRRHQSGEGRAGIYRRDRARRALARLRLGPASPPRLGLFRAALRMGRASDPRRQGLCRRPVAGGDAAKPRHADRARPRTARSATGSVDENLDLFRRMRAGEFPDGARVLRAKIDMASGNINLRDPVMYRILNAPHPRTGTAWHIYPSYDYAHGQSDAIEGVTHSLCTLEFADHQPLYDWFLDNLPVPSRPRQYRVRAAQPQPHGAVEARADRAGARRPRRRLGRSAHADARRAAPARRAAGGDPRLHQARSASRAPTAWSTSPCSSIRSARCSTRRAPRRMAVLRPLKVIIENYPEGQTEELDAVNNPEDPAAGSRPVTFGREIYVERDDFMERPAEEILPPVAGAGSAAPLRLFRQVRRRRQGRRRRGRRAPLHLRSRDARRQHAAGRPQGEGDAALGRGGRRGAGRGAPRQPPVPQPVRPTSANFAADLNPNSLEVARPARCWSRRSRRRMPTSRSSSSGSAISSATPTSAPGQSCLQPHGRVA